MKYWVILIINSFPIETMYIIVTVKPLEVIQTLELVIQI